MCSISPSSLLCPTCLGLLFARLLRQVELGRRSANAKAGHLRQSGSLYSRSTAKAFIASPAETGRCSQQLSSMPVSSSSCLAPGWAVACLTTPYEIAISRYTGLRYCDTIFSHDTSPNIVICSQTLELQYVT